MGSWTQYQLRNGILAYLQILFITHSIYRWIPQSLHIFIQILPVLLLTPGILLSVCFWFLILLGNCGCFLLCWVIISLFHGDQLPINNNQLFWGCRPHLLPPLLAPGLYFSCCVLMNFGFVPLLFFKYSLICHATIDRGREVQEFL